MRISTATTHIETNFRQSRLLQSLMAWYLAVWMITAINPLDRKDWVLENVLAVTLVAALAGGIIGALQGDWLARFCR